MIMSKSEMTFFMSIMTNELFYAIYIYNKKLRTEDCINKYN